MQIYVHISGKNYGPYTLDQLREYVSKGSIENDSQACYDGKNWVTISDIPGFAKVAEKPKQPTVTTQEKPKKKKEEDSKRQAGSCQSVCIHRSYPHWLFVICGNQLHAR